MSNAIRRLTSLILPAALIAGMFALWQQRQAIYDWTRLRDYEPAAAIVQLASDTTMNDSARRLFYVNHPQLNTREQFSQNCTNLGEQTIVLGCYVSRTGIYLFDVDDPRLDGVEQVTAAHELLHAAYDRLGAEEKSRIDNLTQQTLNALTNQRIRDTVENYRKKDPSIVPNELHSIIGTEVRDLPSELEEYYGRYFTNRAQIVGFSEKYERVLTERRKRAEALEAQITALRGQIDQLENSLTTQRAALQRDRADIDTQAEVNAYNARVATYNADVREFNQLVVQHNNLVKEHEANALEEQSLFKALDSRPTL